MPPICGGEGRNPAVRLPLGQLTGEYLVLSGVARFLVEFIRINPRIYWGMTNAQVASLGSIVAGILLVSGPGATAQRPRPGLPM